MPKQDLVQWPEHLWSLSGVKNWILSATHLGHTHVEGPTRIHNKKSWGVTAEFQLGHELVVFKGCKLPLFSKRTFTEVLLSRCCPECIPELLAWNALPNGETWTLHRSFSGVDVEATGKFDHILEMVRILGKIQVKVAELPAPDGLLPPRTPIEHVPAMLEHMIHRIARGYLDAWRADDGALLHEFALPADVLEHLEYFRHR